MLQIVPFVRKAVDSGEFMANMIRETPTELMYSAAMDVTKEMASFIKSNVPKFSVTNVISTFKPSFHIPFVRRPNDPLPIEPSNEWSIREVPYTTPTKTVTMVDRSSSTDDLPSSFIDTFSTANTNVNPSSIISLPLLAPNSTGHEIAAVFIKSFIKIFLKVALTFILEVVILSLRLLSQ